MNRLMTKDKIYNMMIPALSILVGLALLTSSYGHVVHKVADARKERSTGTDMPPLSCTDEMNPVCGENGQMYANKCLMEGAGVVEGSPGCNCSCSMEHKPVNGEDNKWYMNKCFMECAGVKSKNQNHWFCATTLEWFPVCGIDGKTYGNRGSLACAGIDEAYPGRCECSCNKYGEAWVCGKNGMSFYNKCQMGCELGNLEIAYDGECVYDSDGKWVPDGKPADKN